jgi:hypothetical protein
MLHAAGAAALRGLWSWASSCTIVLAACCVNTSQVSRSTRQTCGFKIPLEKDVATAHGAVVGAAQLARPVSGACCHGVPWTLAVATTSDTSGKRWWRSILWDWHLLAVCPEVPRDVCKCWGERNLNRARPGWLTQPADSSESASVLARP